MGCNPLHLLQFLPSVQIMNAVRRIYNYTHSNWLQAYPILTDRNMDPLVFPLPGESVTCV